jgi:hypothetical protein
MIARHERPVLLRPDCTELARSERQSLTRAITADVLAKVRRDDPINVLKSAWPRDSHAEMILRRARAAMAAFANAIWFVQSTARKSKSMAARAGMDRTVA